MTCLTEHPSAAADIFPFDSENTKLQTTECFYQQQTVFIKLYQKKPK